MNDMKKTICFFGSYNKTHRNNSIINGLRANGHVVIECFDDSKGIQKYKNLYKKHSSLQGKYDFLFIGFPNHGLVILAKLLTRKPIIFDPFISLYNTIVEDRKQSTKYSLSSAKAYILDKLSVYIADLVISDTSSHADYFVRTFKVRR